MSEEIPVPQIDRIELAADLVSAYISNNSVPAIELPSLILQVHAALLGLAIPETPAQDDIEKATSGQIKKSITPDALISFIDGKPYKTLKRHLTTHGLDFETYRRRYGLPNDYPTVAANYSAARSALAKDLGLGQQRRKPAELAAASGEAMSEPTKPRGRAKAASTEPNESAPKKRGRKAAAAAA